MNNNTYNNLKNLYERNYDAERGYDLVAQKVDNTALGELFRSFVRQRFDFHTAIRKEIEAMGKSVDKDRSLKADFHQEWIKIKATFTGGDENAMLTEVLRGEDALINQYEETLEDSTLAPSTQQILRNQLQSIRDNKERMEKLEKAFA
ncbi:MAG: PA2169 family four-helix-bundle protein [Bacteroidota bacterium]